MKREYPEGPIVGVGAVVFDDEAVLVVRRNQDPEKSGSGERPMEFARWSR